MNRTPPGPRGLLTMLRFARRLEADPLGGFLDLARTYGDLVMLGLGPIRICLVNHPDLVREVLVVQVKSFRKPQRLKRNLAKVVGNGLLTNDARFGAGPRVCIGNTFAMMTMKLVVATVLQHNRLALAHGQGEAKIEPLLVLRPKGGLRMTAEKRPALATASMS